MPFIVSCRPWAPSRPTARRCSSPSGGVRLALRLSHVREILAVAPDSGEVCVRGEPLPTAFVSTVLGLPAGPAPDTRS